MTSKPPGTTLPQNNPLPFRPATGTSSDRIKPTPADQQQPTHLLHRAFRPLPKLLHAERKARASVNLS